MVRTLRSLAPAAALAALLTAAAGTGTAQYAPPCQAAPAVAAYYPPPAVSYYPPPAASYYAPPAVSYYAPPAVSYYAPPAVSYYAAPAAPAYAAESVTTRYGLFGRPRVTNAQYYAPAYVGP